jgi:hypothetical protein
MPPNDRTRGLRSAARLTTRRHPVQPLWLFWFVLTFFNNWWHGFLLTFADRSTIAFVIAYRAWPTVVLRGPIMLMFGAIVAYRLHLVSRIMPMIGIVGVLVVTILTGWPEYQRLAPYIGRAAVPHVLRAIDPGIPSAVAIGFFSTLIGWGLTSRTNGILAPGSAPIRCAGGPIILAMPADFPCGMRASLASSSANGAVKANRPSTTRPRGVCSAPCKTLTPPRSSPSCAASTVSLRHR